MKSIRTALILVASFACGLGGLASHSWAQDAKGGGGGAHPCDVMPPTRRTCAECLRFELQECRNRRQVPPEEVAACFEAAQDGYWWCLHQIPNTTPAPPRRPAPIVPAPTAPALPAQQLQEVLASIFAADIDADGYLASADVFEAIRRLMSGDLDQELFFRFINEFFARTTMLEVV